MSRVQRVVDSGQPTLTEAEQRAAIASLRRQYEAGGLSEREVQKLTATVWRSNTPHELYRRSHGMLGDPSRTDGRQWWRVAAFWTAVVLALVLVTWMTAMAARDGLFTGG